MMMSVILVSHFKRYWKIIFIFYFIFFGSVAGGLTFLKNIYTSQAMFYPIEQDEDASGSSLMALARVKAGIALGGGGGSNPVLIFKEYLTTWTFADSLSAAIDSGEKKFLFNPIPVSTLKARSKILNWCKKNITMTSNALSGVITLKISAPKEIIAQELVYKVTQILNKVNEEMNREKLIKQEGFLEKSIQDVRQQLNEKDLQLVKLENTNFGVNSPEMHYQRVKLIREQKILEETFSILESQIVEAGIKEQQLTQALRFMEKPTFPPEKDRPNRTMILLASLLGFIFIHTSIILLWENRKQFQIEKERP